MSSYVTYFLQKPADVFGWSYQVHQLPDIGLVTWIPEHLEEVTLRTHHAFQRKRIVDRNQAGAWDATPAGLRRRVIESSIMPPPTSKNYCDCAATTFEYVFSRRKKSKRTSSTRHPGAAARLHSTSPS